MFSQSEASTLQLTELNYILPSSRLPQYKCLAALGQKKFAINVKAKFEAAVYNLIGQFLAI